MPGHPPCKIDETGTPNGSDAFTTPTNNLNTASDTRSSGLNDAVKGDGKDTTWGGAAPGAGVSGGCYQGHVFNVASVSVDLNLCQYSGTIQMFMSFIWVVTTWFFCAGMVKRTMDAN